MDYDGTLSTELAMLRKQKDEYNDVLTIPPLLHNDGSQMATQYGVNCAIIPKGAANVEVAKDFAKYLVRPDVNGKYLKGGLGRNLPIFPELVKDDPFWIDPKQDPHRPPYVKEGFGGGELVPFYYIHNPAWAKVRSEHPFNVAIHDVIKEGAKPQDAVAKAYARIEEIFSTFEIKA